MDDFVWARVVHVLGVALWIGGVAFVTTVMLSALRRNAGHENPAALFERLEGRFAWQARVTTLLTGASGLYMLHVLDGWARFSEPGNWWLWAMSGMP